MADNGVAGSGSVAVARVEGPGTGRPGTAVVSAGPARLLRPIAPAGEVIAAQNEMRDMITQSLEKGRDFGKVPGIDKPFLFKAGAERICVGMGCYFGEPRIVEQEVDHDRVVKWQKRRKVFEGKGKARRYVRDEIETGESLGLYRYVVATPVIHRETGQVVGEGIASCSTMESKYVDRPRDSENTVLKMAHKRSAVAATLLAFGLSDQFTQDEDVVDAATGGADREAAGSDEPEPECPKCKGAMWDNRADNDERAAKGQKLRPDWKCKDRDCDGVFWRGEWPPQQQAAAAGASDPATGEVVHTGAAAKRFPKWPKFPQHEGKPLGDITTQELRDVLPAAEKVSEKLAEAIREVLDDRIFGDEGQASLPVEEPRRTPSGGSAVVPPPGRVEDALASGGNGEAGEETTRGASPASPTASGSTTKGTASAPDPDSEVARTKHLQQLLKHPATPKDVAAAMKQKIVNGLKARDRERAIAELEARIAEHDRTVGTHTSPGVDESILGF